MRNFKKAGHHIFFISSLSVLLTYCSNADSNPITTGDKDSIVKPASDISKAKNVSAKMPFRTFDNLDIVYQEIEELYNRADLYRFYFYPYEHDGNIRLYGFALRSGEGQEPIGTFYVPNDGQVTEPPVVDPTVTGWQFTKREIDCFINGRNFNRIHLRPINITAFDGSQVKSYQVFIDTDRTHSIHLNPSPPATFLFKKK